ncbi:MAG TPA: host attachment protein [Steroidobacteraceae bacterium]|nr:host attachment protein [Steroidobacteraceae bacterium]
MRIRIVVANQAEAAFYDLDSRTGDPKFATRLTDPLAHLHDRDLKSDRPGRFSDHALLSPGRRGATAHHGTGGERRPRKHEAEVFARQVAGQLEHAQRNAEFDRLVVMAAPPFLGVLRKMLPDSVRLQVAAEVSKDLVNQPPASVRAHMPPDVLRELPVM